MFKAGDIQSHWCSRAEICTCLLLSAERACIQKQGLESTHGGCSSIVTYNRYSYRYYVHVGVLSLLLLSQRTCGALETLFESVASRGSVSAECNLCKPFVHVILSFEAFPLHHVFLAVYMHKVVSDSAVWRFFFLLFRCIFCVVCKCTAWFAVVVRVVYSEYYYYGKNYYVCIITCRLTSCPKCVSVFFFLLVRDQWFQNTKYKVPICALNSFFVFVV